jgi:capsular exopolysaccharide synthesis family protein
LVEQRMPAPAGAAPAALGGPAVPSGTAAGELALRRLWEALRRNLGLVLGTVLLLDIAVAAWLLVRPLEWTATAELLIEADERNFGNLRDEIDFRVDRLQPADLESEVKLLASRRLALRVIEEERLAELVEPEPLAERLRTMLAGAGEWLLDWVAGARSSFAGYPTDLRARSPDEPEVPTPDPEAVLDRFAKSLEVRRDPLARVVLVAYRTDDRERAVRVVDRIVRVYLEERVAAQREALEQTARYMEERLAVLARELEEAERRVKEFQSRTGLFAVDGASVLERRWAELGRELTQARVQLADAEARLEQVEAARASRGLSGLREVANSPVIGELRRQEAELARRIADLSGQYGPRHPLMQNAQAELADIRRSIAAEIDRIVAGLANERAVAAERVRRLEAELAEAEARLSRVGTSQVELEELVRRAEAARKVYETMLDRYRRASEQRNLIRPAARVISPPTPPSRPSNAPKALVLTFTTLAGLGLGCGFAFLRELRREGFLTSEELERELALPVLAVLPLLPEGAAERAAAEPSGGAEPPLLLAYREGVQRILSRVVVEPPARGARRGRLLVVTSAFPGDGKTTLALALARQCARSGRRTLLIDADLRRRSLDRLLAVPADQPGLVQLLDGSCRSIDRAMIQETGSGLKILPAGGSPDSPPDLLGSPKARVLLGALREVCDLVVLDLPPVLAASDALSLAPVLDAALLVVRWEGTPRDAVQAAVRELRALEVPLVGVALNAVDLSVYSRYGSPDHLRYAGHYAQYYAGRG